MREFIINQQTKIIRRLSLPVVLLLLLVLALVSALPLAAYAAPPLANNTWQFSASSPNETNVAYGGGTYSWSQSTKTLTLNGVNHTTGAATALKISVPGAKIVLQGANTIRSTFNASNDTFGIFADQDLTISGTGSLNVIAGTSTNSACDSDAIAAMGTLTISGGTVNATGGNTFGKSHGIITDGNILISGAIVKASGGNSTAERSVGISSGGTITINSGTVQGTSASANKDSYGIAANNTVTINGGTVTGTGGSAKGLSCGISSIYASVAVVGGESIIAKGNSYAIYKTFTMPKNCKFLLSANTAGTNPTTGVSSTTGSKIDGTAYKYVSLTPLKTAPGTAPASLKAMTLKVTSPKSAKITKNTKSIKIKVTPGAKVTVSAAKLKAGSKIKNVVTKGSTHTFKKLNFKGVKKGTWVKITATKAGYASKTIKYKLK